jgi:hypothetical protein
MAEEFQDNNILDIELIYSGRTRLKLCEFKPLAIDSSLREVTKHALHYLLQIFGADRFRNFLFEFKVIN